MGESRNVNSHPSDKDLTAFANGKLAELRAAMVEQHVARCDRCAAAVARSPHDDFIALLSAAERAHSTVTGHGAAAVDQQTEMIPGPVQDAPRSLPPALRNHERYRIIRWLAEGGMGVVFLAEHRLLRIPVAIKTLTANRAQDAKSLDRFLQEAKVAAQLNHANIAQVVDAEQIGDLVFLAIEYVPGKTLAQIVMKQGPLRVTAACDYIRQAALGLDHAASRGVVHRDVKPQNLMLMTPKGVVKILDFGLGRLVDEDRTHGRLTAHEDILGTPHFIAPEQIRDSRSADIRSDIYGLGCTFYFLLAGEAPFRGSNPLELLDKHATESPPSIRSLRHDVSIEVDALIRSMLAKEPRDRPQSPAEIVAALAAPQDSPAATRVSATVTAPRKAVEQRPNPVRNGTSWVQLASSPVVLLPLVTALVTAAVLFLF